MNRFFLSLCLLVGLGYQSASAQRRGAPVPVEGLAPSSIFDVNAKKNVNFNHLVTASNDTIYIVSFWASWCPPCLQELSMYQRKISEWQTSYHVKLIPISVDALDDPSELKEFGEKRKWDFGLYSDLNAATSSFYKITSIPQSLFIQHRQIAKRMLGFNGDSEAEIEELLEQLRTQH